MTVPAYFTAWHLFVLASVGIIFSLALYGMFRH